MKEHLFIFSFGVIIITCSCVSATVTKSLSKINEIPELLKKTVHISDKLELLRKINKIVADGHDKLQIVTDFDHTLTRHTMDNGTLVLTSFGMFEKCPSIPQHYKDAVKRLIDTYRPIEDDPLISVEEKRKYMTKWYNTSRDLIVNLTYPQNELLEIAKEMVPSFRQGVKDLITWSQEHEVPVLVFSAGLGEAVTAALEAADLQKPHVKVISNFLKFDDLDRNRIIGFKGNLISIYNKNQGVIKGTEYYKSVKNRSNVILMGDSIGDADMTLGMDNCNTIIKVGFLGNKISGNLNNYLQNYDIVLVNEPSITVVNAILKLMT